MKEKLELLRKQIIEKIPSIKDINILDDLQTKYMGRKGEFTKILRSISELGLNEKKEIGQMANNIKIELQNKFKEIREKIDSLAVKESIDVTLPGVEIKQGHLHPISQIQYELEDFFATLGFSVVEGLELESDYYNFESLNIPTFHPARDMQDTFYIDIKNKEGNYDLLLRTHTSSVQVRAMEKFGAPLKCIIPGRCFRSEATDVRHEHTFYQLEGLMIDEKINLANLKGLLETVARYLYGQQTEVRMRPKFYPFVEPGVNGEVTCFLCAGKGCRLCKFTGWLEIFGAGMIHPNVLKAGKIDGEKYSGYAFGFGLTRLSQLRHGIDDIRLFNSGDLRFLTQF